MLHRSAAQLPRHLRATASATLEHLDDLANSWTSERERICRETRRKHHTRTEWTATGVCHTRVRARLQTLTASLAAPTPNVWDRALAVLAGVYDQLHHCRDRPDTQLPEPVILDAAATAEVRSGLGLPANCDDATNVESADGIALALTCTRPDEQLEVRARVQGLRDNRQTRAWRARTLPTTPIDLPGQRRMLEALYEPLPGHSLPLALARTSLDLADEFSRQRQFEISSDLAHRALTDLDELKFACTCTIYDSDRARALLALGRYALRQDRRNQAADYLNKALSVTRQVRGPDHLETAEVYHHLGALNERAGHFSDAVVNYRQALKIRLQQLGPDPVTARTTNNLARSLYYLRAFAEAAELHLATLNIRIATLGRKHPDTATSINNLGAVYRAQGDNERAVEMFQQALEIRREVLGNAHPYTAISLHNLASMALVFGDHQKSLQLHQQALEIRSGLLGPDHVETARSLQGLAHTYRALGHRDKAVEHCERALLIFARKLGDAHPETRAARELLHELRAAAPRGVDSGDGRQRGTQATPDSSRNPEKPG